MVDNNDKKRYQLELETDQFGFEQYIIRAVQGHTIKDVKEDELLKPILDPFQYDEVVHGTQLDVVKFLLQTGLNKMARNHVHMAIGMPGKKGVISGMRQSCKAVVEVNMVRAIKDASIPFFIS